MADDDNRTNALVPKTSKKVAKLEKRARKLAQASSQGLEEGA